MDTNKREGNILQEQSKIAIQILWNKNMKAHNKNMEPKQEYNQSVEEAESARGDQAQEVAPMKARLSRRAVGSC